MRTAEQVPSGSKLADTITIIDAMSAQVLKNLGFNGVWRYGETLTNREIDILNMTGLGVLLCFYADDFDGNRHVATAASLSYPRTASIATDLESEHEGEDVVFGRVDACGLEHQKGGYQSALYEGCDQPLNGHRIYQLPHVDHYWRSASFVEEPLCGYCCYQVRGASNIHLPGLPFLVDVNFTELDKNGRSLVWCVNK